MRPILGLVSCAAEVRIVFWWSIRCSVMGVSFSSSGGVAPGVPTAPSTGVAPGVLTALSTCMALQLGSLFDSCGALPMGVLGWSVLILDVCSFVHVLWRKVCLTMKGKDGRIEACYLVFRVHQFQARGNSQLLHILRHRSLRLNTFKFSTRLWLKMKPEYKPLKELTSKVKKYKTKVKVVHKGYPQRSPNKAQSRYQRIILEDEEGFTMKGALFNNDIERYAEALQRKGEYELDDATVNPVPDQYALRPNECSLVINDRARITPVKADPETLAPEYQTISTIPRDPFDKHLYDVLGIILYVSETKEVKHSSGKVDNVREVHIIDHSYDRPFAISLWNEIITVHETLLNSWPDSFTVAGFLALTSRTYKGFVMSSSMSTAILADPQGPKAQALKEWAARNKDALIDHRSKLSQLHAPSKKETITTIETINLKKAHNTWQEETFTIRATFPTASVEQMHLYVGCNKCSRKCDVEPGTKFTCQHCYVPDAVGDPRLILKTDAVDETGSIELPIFAKDIEQVLGSNALSLWTLSKNEDIDAIATKMNDMRQRTFLIKIGPTLALSTSRVLSWAVRGIAVENPPDETPTDNPGADTADEQADKPSTDPTDDLAADAVIVSKDEEDD